MSRSDTIQIIHDVPAMKENLDKILKKAQHTTDSSIRSIIVASDVHDRKVLHVYENEFPSMKKTLLGTLYFDMETRMGVEFKIKVEIEDPYRGVNLWNFFF